MALRIRRAHAMVGAARRHHGDVLVPEMQPRHAVAGAQPRPVPQLQRPPRARRFRAGRCRTDRSNIR